MTRKHAAQQESQARQLLLSNTRRRMRRSCEKSERCLVKDAGTRSTSSGQTRRVVLRRIVRRVWSRLSSVTYRGRTEAPERTPYLIHVAYLVKARSQLCTHGVRSSLRDLSDPQFPSLSRRCDHGHTTQCDTMTRITLY